MTQNGNSKSSAAIDGKVAEVLPAPRRERRIPLNSAKNVRTELARVYRDMRFGNIDPSEGTKLTYVLTALAKMIEVDDLERRIETLEEQSRQS